MLSPELLKIWLGLVALLRAVVMGKLFVSLIVFDVETATEGCSVDALMREWFDVGSTTDVTSGKNVTYEANDDSTVCTFVLISGKD
jgi:hypothetical protein